MSPLRSWNSRQHFASMQGCWSTGGALRSFRKMTMDGSRPTAFVSFSLPSKALLVLAH